MKLSDRPPPANAPGRPVATAPSRPQWRQRGVFSDRVLGSYLPEVVAATPEATAVVDGPTSLTYGELAAEAARVAAGLAGLGVGAGDVVTVQLPNWWEAAVVHHALAHLGAVINPVVPIYREREVGFILAQARPAAVIVPARFRGVDHVAMLERIVEDQDRSSSRPGRRPPVIVVRSGGVGPGAGSEASSLVAFEDLGGPCPPRPGRRCDDIALLLYTSGTTADPKGVLHSHETLDYEVRSFIDAFALSRSDTVFMPSPLTHITGFLFGLLLPPMTGGAAVFLDVWEPAAAVEAIEAHRARFVMGATPFLHGLVAEYERRGQASALRTFLCGGADVPPALVRRAQAVLGAHVARVYGSTELPTLCCGRPGDDGDICADTDGIPIGPVEYRLEGDGVGELVVEGPERFVGYLDPALNADAFTPDGFFRTGDLARVGPGAAVTITGRSKDIIIRGGENISAKEVEDLLFGHPDVAEVAVVAMPDPVLVERACAFVVPAPGATPTLAGLTGYLDGLGLARQKLPERLELIDALPLTASGKVQKYLLRQRISDLMETST